ncbi:TetR family transcriptional regulator [Roseiarcus fermentans]|uniref:TetR family transcriptional regulator n=1 Tax=Roseiarcus fermentans TaxID=1473586 RepID=A0A366FPY2_9HYPH|nr:TetR/AcrR family transcriptional regulator [Roseiarcus fermentans]RBP16764.1 TetR family transcriptional regulator [Roseiarcus fermentans]
MVKSSAKAAGATTSAKRARDRVFDVASDLFYRKGVHAVGVDEIVKEAGVAKISLYRSFASKDALVVAYLEQRGRTFLHHWDETFAQYHDNPRAQLQAIMTYIAERTTEAGYRGCPFINFCAEFPDASHPGRRIARAAKEAMFERFLHISEALPAPQPRDLANALLLLVEGAYAISQTYGGGTDGVGQSLVWASDALVDAQLRKR